MIIKLEALVPKFVIFLACLVAVELCFFYRYHGPQYSDHQLTERDLDAPSFVIQQQQQTSTSASVAMHPPVLTTAHAKSTTSSQECILLRHEHMYQFHGCKPKNAQARASRSSRLLPDSFWKLCTARPYDFHYHINRPDFCSRHKYANLIIIIIPSNHVQMRKVIRRTWHQRMVYRNHTIGRLFIVGKQMSQAQQELVESESLHYKDMIQERDILDTYANLTYKMLMGLDWVSIYCPQAQYIIKLDEDSQMERPVKVVDYIINSKPSDSAVICFAKVGGIPPVIRNYGNKWCVTRAQYPGNSYPEYCAGGGGYAMPTPVARQLLSMSYVTRFFWLEDVYVTGILRVKVGGISVVWVQQVNDFHKTLNTDGSKKLTSPKARSKLREKD